jgi:hypothetical protein
MQAARKWSVAQELFAKVVKIQTMDDVHMGLESREEWAWCGVLDAEESQGDEAREKLEESLHVFEDVKIKLDRENGLEGRKARVWWRLGQCYWRLGGRRTLSFLAAILTIVRVRARKCIQTLYHSVEAPPVICTGFHSTWDILS